MAYSRHSTDVANRFQSLIIPHTKFVAAVKSIESAMDVGKLTGTFAGVRITAPSGSGKTALLGYVRSNLGTSEFDDKAKDIVDASLKENPSVSQVQSALLEKFDYAVPARAASNNDVNVILVKAINHNRTKLIVLDEFQHVFLAGGVKFATPVIDWLKRLMNLVQVPVVLLGTEALDRLEGMDEQLTSRVPTIARLSHFSLNGEWRGFLTALSNGCKEFDMTLLAKDRTAAIALWAATGGSPRHTKTLLVHAICIGLTAEKSVLTMDILRDAFIAHRGPDGALENPFASD